MAEHASCPQWVTDEPCIQDRLLRLLDRYNRGVKNAFVITKKSLPQLFDFVGDHKYLWQLITELQNRHHIIEIKCRLV